MPAEVVLLANFLVGVVLLVGSTSDRLAGSLSRQAAAFAALPLVAALLVTVYVFGEDSYRGGGISRWEAYRSPGGALGPMFVLFLLLLIACAGLLLYAGRRGRLSLLRVTAFVGALGALFLGTATILGFSLN
jgi:hypothetical protein